MCSVQGKENQVLNFLNSFLKDLSWWKERFCKTFIFLGIIQALFVIGCITHVQCLFRISCAIFACQKLKFYMLFKGRSPLKCPTFTQMCPFLFILYVWPGSYADIWPKSSHFNILTSTLFLFFVFCFVLE